MTKFMEVKRNTKGTDYWSGDAHGCISKIEEALERVGFDKSKDRLFLLGDLCDRGPESHRIADLLKEGWALAVQGNHDCVTSHAARQVLMHDYSREDKDSRISYSNGGEWIENQKRAVLEDFIETIKYLPIAIEYQDHDGTPLLGLIHGEVPMGSSWTELAVMLQELPWDFVSSLSTQNSDLLHQCLWGRTKIKAAELNKDAASDAYITDGIPYLACGHSIVPQQDGGPFRVANNRYIDHGLYRNEEAILYTLEQLIGETE